MAVCGSCDKEMTVCNTCGGLICTEGCTDRIDDGCTCEETEDEESDGKKADDEEEEW